MSSDVKSYKMLAQMLSHIKISVLKYMSYFKKVIFN